MWLKRIATAFLVAMVSAVVSLAEAEESKIQGLVSNAVVRLLTVAESETHPPFGSDSFNQTGVLIAEDGHLVTDSSLAVRTNSIVAIFSDGQRSMGTLVASDERSHLAVFKLADHYLVSAPPAPPDEVQDGDV